MHPNHTRFLEAAETYVRGFKPYSIPDLYEYLKSQPLAMVEHGNIVSNLADRLAATFPGALLVHSFYAQFATGYNRMGHLAHGVFEGYKALHAADLARHQSPRVNEQDADIATHGAGGHGVSTLDDGTVMHEYHAKMLEAANLYVAGYNPKAMLAGPDAVSDLIVYLDGQPEALVLMAEQMTAFATHLVEAYPVDKRTHDYYRQLAGGFALLTDQAAELRDAYVHRNRHDVDRRVQPRVNEAWADHGNMARH